MSPHASDPNPHEIAHIVARLAGEEGPDHPRQRAVRWLEENGHSAKVAHLNTSFATRMRGYNSAGTAIFGALADVLGRPAARDVYWEHLDLPRPANRHGGDAFAAFKYASAAR